MPRVYPTLFQKSRFEPTHSPQQLGHWPPPCKPHATRPPGGAFSVCAPGAYQRPGNRRVETINFKDLSKKSTRTSQAAARAAEDVKESFTTQRLKTGGYRGTPLRGEDRAKELKYRSRRRQKIYEALSAGGLPLRTPRQVLGLRFMETYREIPRPRWQP